MAIINDDEEQYKNKETPVSGGTGYISGGMTGGSSTGALPNAPQKQQSGGFTNIVNYLTAPNSSAEMGSNVIGDIEKQGGEAQKDADLYGQFAERNILQGTPQFNQSVANQWMIDTSPTEQAKTDASTKGEAPTVTFGATAPASSYTGPTSFADDKTGTYQRAQGSAEKVRDSAKTLGTTEGLQTALGQKYGYGSGAPGVGRLDTAITKYGGGGGKIVEDASKKWQGIGNYLQGTEQKVGSQIEAAKNQAKSVSDQWAAAQTAATNNAKTTNSIYSGLIDAKKKADKEAYDKKVKEEAEAAERQRQGAENQAWGKKYLDDIDRAKENSEIEQRKAQVSQWRRKGTGDGYLWTESDFDHYIKTGEGPQAKQYREASEEGGGYI